MNIYEKLMEIRYEFLDLDIKKSGHNKFSNFKYYELKDFLPTATRKFRDSKLYSKFSIIPASSEVEETAVFIITNAENPEEVEEYRIPTAECFIGRKKDGTGGADPIQNLGGKITFLRRYMYFIVLDLIEDDSVDYQDNTNRTYDTTQQKSDYSQLNEQQAFNKAQEDGKAKLIKALDKAENIPYKDIVIKNVCAICEVDSWKDITFKGNLTYKKLTDIVAQELQKEKDLAEAGV